jgi:putative quinone oxidoreductase, YhdH/YhfP family
VIFTSYDLGMNTSGGFGQFIRVPSAWVVPLPEGMTLRESMVYGTAGYTAGLSVNALLRQGLTPEQGPIVVTGASGGVGSVSVTLLAGLGFQVKASSGKTEAAGFLRELGAKEIIGREEVNDESGKPMLKQLWAGGIDTVGGNALSTMIKACQAGGAVAVSGNVASPDLPITVFPFILRGVNVLGIDSQNTTMALRRKVWNLLAGEWKPKNLENLAKECTLDQPDPEIERILSGAQQGPGSGEIYNKYFIKPKRKKPLTEHHPIFFFPEIRNGPKNLGKTFCPPIFPQPHPLLVSPSPETGKPNSGPQ